MNINSKPQGQQAADSKRQESKMRSAEFTDIQEAAQYRRQNGGWLFVIGETNAWWCYIQQFRLSASIYRELRARGLSAEACGGTI